MKFGCRESEAIYLKVYNKLVRDKIPQIIEGDKREAVYRFLSDEEYMEELDKKLSEEVREYQEDRSLEEMADILEVLFAICEARGYSLDELETKRTEKSEERGGFKDKIFLKYTDE
jgi:predicted house-cleaning noncanonical NTP pyrophosphatase (MazG superfamily)